MRNLCKDCEQKPVAINYYKDGVPFYRSKCDQCARQRKNGSPLWARTGYQKKTSCEKCGFASRHPEQFSIFYLDGNPTNCRYTNLKTVCANCQRILHIVKTPWRQGDLTPDRPRIK